MARVHFWNLSGTVGSISFVQRNGQTFARAKRVPIGKKAFANDPRYERQRKNVAEFGRAATAVKLLRFILKKMVGTSGDNTVTCRLQKTLMEVVKSDKLNECGMRTVSNGDLNLIDNFKFREDLNTHCCRCRVISFCRNSGTLTVEYSIMNRSLYQFRKSNSRYCTLSVVAIAVDFDINRFTAAITDAGKIGVANQTGEWQQATCKLDVPANSIVLLVVHAKFFTAVDAPVGGGRFDVLQVMEVFQPNTAAVQASGPSA